MMSLDRLELRVNLRRGRLLLRLDRRLFYPLKFLLLFGQILPDVRLFLLDLLEDHHCGPRHSPNLARRRSARLSFHQRVLPAHVLLDLAHVRLVFLYVHNFFLFFWSALRNYFTTAEPFPERLAGAIATPAGLDYIRGPVSHTHPTNLLVCPGAPQVLLNSRGCSLSQELLLSQVLLDREGFLLLCEEFFGFVGPKVFLYENYTLDVGGFELL